MDTSSLVLAYREEKTLTIRSRPQIQNRIYRFTRKATRSRIWRRHPLKVCALITPAFGGVEFYTPAYFNQLETAIQQLGWGPNNLPSRDIVEWVKNIRRSAYGSAWQNIGTIKPLVRHSQHPFPADYSAPLPSNVKYASGSIHHLTPSLICIIMGFVFEAPFSSGLDEALRTDRKTMLIPHGTGCRIMGPLQQKMEQVHGIRARASRTDSDWFSEHIPGVFSSQFLGEGIPICELINFRQTKSYSVDEQERRFPFSWNH